MKTSTKLSKRSIWISLLLVLGIVVNGYSAAHVTMGSANCTAGTNYVQFDLVVTNDGTTALSFNSVSTRLALSANMFPSGSQVTCTYQGNSQFPASFVTLGTTGTYNITPATLSAAGQFLITSSTGDYVVGTSVNMPIGTQMTIGTFRLTNATNFTPGLTTGVTFVSTSGLVLYSGGVSTNFNTTNRAINAMCSYTIPSACTPPTLAMQVSGVSGCAGSTTGNVDPNPTGGSAPFTYLWNNGATTPTLSGVSAGTYTVTVTATGGCTASGSATIGEGPAATTYYADADGDGFGDPAASTQSCTGAPLGYVSNNLDCNDGNAAIHPGANEVCNGIDDNCNGSIDEGLAYTLYYTDADGDGFGAGTGTSLCADPGAGYSTNNTDCNDNDATVHATTGYYVDGDNDGFGAGAAVQLCSASAPAGYSANNTDCNDGNANINPGATEVCNGIDDNCNGSVDEGLTFVTYYVDADQDGFGAGTGTSLCSNPGAGYSLNNTDCNDANSAINPNATEVCNGIDDNCNGLADEGLTFVTYYKDNDGDGFGNALISVSSCNGAPATYVADNTDCNDNDASVHTPQSYYIDADGDGFGSSLATQLCASTAPSGYSSVSGDCNDNDATVHTPQSYFVDADQDGFGSTATALLCSSTAPAGYSTNNTDCNDNDASVNAPQSYYIDADGDGFGSTATALLCSSTAPAGYSTNNTDCNDNDASVNAPQSYYVDADGDGFGSTTTALLCSSVATSGYSTNNTDCNDNDASVHAPQSYYVDADQDGFGSTTTALLCSSVATAGYSTNNTDCNDNDASVHAPQPYYTDNDGDGYGAGPVVMLCSSTAPSGYSVNNTDCNDGNANIFPTAPEQCNGIDDNCDGIIDNGVVFSTFYQDLDNDGVGNAAVSQVACSAPVGYVLTSGDCNDNDATVQTPQPYYADNDGDGYGAGSVVMLCSSTAPSGYSVNNLDCNDGNGAIHPGAAEVCNGIDDNCNGSIDEGLTFVTYYVDADGDGFGAGTGTSLCSDPGAGYSTNNTDCNDNDASVHAPQSYYVDADGDGFGSTATASLCSSTAPAGYSTNNTDCNDNDASVHAPQSYFVDNDGDGYGSTTTALVCSSTATAGYSTNNTDCNDGNAAINPGAAEVCNGIDDNCNGSVDEGLTFVVYYADVDGDGYGNFANSIQSCNGVPAGYVSDNTDCNDAVPSIHPGATEICGNGIDDNCNGLVDEGCAAGCTNAPTANAGVGSAICDGSTISLNGSIGGGATNGTWSSNGTGSFSNAGLLNAVYSPSSADYAAGSVTLTLTTDAPVGCTAAVSSVTYTFTALPSPIGVISGPTALCNPSTAATFTYSVAPVAGINTYTWSVPANTTIVSGQGTPTLVVKWSALAIHNGVVGAVSVVGNNSNGCGTAIPSTLDISVQLQVPVTPPSISGAQAVCPGDVVQYSIALVARAGSYTWSVPAGAQILSGQGSNMVTVQFNGAFVGGNMSVTADNGCGSSPARLGPLVRNVLPASASITGPVNGVCNLNGVVYTAASITGATSYVWTVPAGASIVGPASGSSITVNFGTISSGAVTVAGVNNCGAGAVRSLTVTGTPAQAGVISGPLSVCVGQQYLYSVNTVAGAASYSWTVSSRLSIVSGQGSKNLTASGVATGTNVTVNVTASNACGVSPVRVLAGITVAICPRVGTEAGSVSLTAYPNPVSDVLNVSFNSEKAQDYTVRMLDATGRIVMADAKTAAEGENKVEMSVKGLASGIYMLQFNMGDHTEQMRIYVN